MSSPVKLTFSEFRLNKEDTEVAVERGLTRKGTTQTQRLHGAGNRSQFSQMRLGPRTRDQSQTPIVFAGKLDPQQGSRGEGKHRIVFRRTDDHRPAAIA